jgi:hypothetical protein
MNTRKSVINYLINHGYTSSYSSKGRPRTSNHKRYTKEKQIPTIDYKHINKFPTHLSQAIQSTQKEEEKCTTFTYFGPETITILTYFRIQT